MRLLQAHGIARLADFLLPMVMLKLTNGADRLCSASWCPAVPLFPAANPDWWPETIQQISPI
jgi:hypothetical protein